MAKKKAAKKKSSEVTEMFGGLVQIIGVNKSGRDKIAKAIMKGVKDGKAG